MMIPIKERDIICNETNGEYINDTEIIENEQEIEIDE